jgi:hypothetical protein
VKPPLFLRTYYVALIGLFHFTLRSESLLFAMPDHVIRILRCGIPVLVRKRPSLFLPFPSSIWCPLSSLTQQSPTATQWKLQSVLCSSFALCFAYKEPQSHRHLYVQYPAHVYPTMSSTSIPKTTSNPLPQYTTLVRDPPISATNILIRQVTYMSTSQ